MKTIFSLQAKLPSQICDKCLCEFEFIKGPLCKQCGRPQKKNQLCHDCQQWHRQCPNLRMSNRALMAYNAASKAYFQQYKGLGDYRLHRLFEAQLTVFVKCQRQTLYVPIPTDSEHFKERGFNPVVGLFHAIVPLTPLLEKLPTPVGQAQKNRQERLATPQFFELSAHLPPEPQAIILLDDIYTTGRTLIHAVQCLQTFYPNCAIDSITLAR